MSPRAACRLEAFGFRPVYDYVTGKADWLASGLPTEGRLQHDPRDVVTASSTYAGYGSWDGNDGTLRPPDGTITTDKPGSGAGRLLELVDGGPAGRFRVRIAPCGPGG